MKVKISLNLGISVRFMDKVMQTGAVVETRHCLVCMIYNPGECFCLLCNQILNR